MNEKPNNNGSSQFLKTDSGKTKSQPIKTDPIAIKKTFTLLSSAKAKLDLMNLKEAKCRKFSQKIDQQEWKAALVLKKITMG